MVRAAKPAKAKVEAGPPVTRKSRKAAGSTGRQLEQRLTEALEQQAATSEILHAISRSPTDLDPVFRMILANATRLCGASVATLWLFDGELLSSVAHQNASPAFAEYLARARIRPSRETTTRRAALERKTIHVPDLLSDPDFSPPEFQRKEKVRTVLSVPLLRQDTLVGVVTLWRREVRPFTDRQVALVETFADQAVIAIENVRLFNEVETRNRDLTEALEQQTATSDILRVISSSPTDLQPIFEAIVRRASQLCDGHRTVLVRLAGDEMHLAAVYNAKPRTVTSANFPRRLGRELAVGRAILDGTLVHIPDARKDPEYSRDLARALELGSVLSVPLVRDGKPIGAIGVSRANPGSFSENRIQLLKTFADQAVIAIENVRLFKELETRNRDLTEALEQQTATSDILRVISQSPTDVQPVFDTIAAAALKLCRATSANVFTYDGELVHLAAVVNVDPGYIEALRAFYPRALSRESAILRAIQTRSVAVIPDVLEDKDYVPVIAARATAGRFRSIVAVPLMREGKAIGGIAVGRAESGSFPDAQVALLKTFADQAVIAIENVRLFTELEARNNELRVALEHQTATSDLLKVIGRSAFDLQPVFETLAENAARLCAAQRALIFRFDGQFLRFAVGHNVSPELRAFLDQHPIAPGRGSNAGRAALERRTIHNHDVLSDPGYSYGGYKVDPYRTVLTVPMLKSDELLGVVIVYRHEVRPFSDNQIALMETFADQAVIAIENVRLFNETREALERQTATAEILKVISSSPTDVQPVFGAIAERAAALCEAEFGFVATYDGDLIHHRASVGPSPEALELHRAGYPMKPGTSSVTARVVLQGVPVQIEDMFADPAYAQKIAAETGGFRSGMGVPMVREGNVIGAIVVVRTVPGKFSERQVGLLQTFADQAVIAIENVRLFKELETRNGDLTEALEQQTATSDILRVISQSPNDVQPVFDTIAGSALKLCNASSALVFTFDGKLIHLAAIANLDPAAANLWRRAFPRPPSRDTASTRAVLTRSIVAVPDVLEDPDYVIGPAAASTGFRSALAVPLIREGNPIGVIGVGRPEAGLFPGKQITLLQTFADQAVIAIENVRLFTELEARTKQLTRSVGELKALGDVGQAVSSTLDLPTVLRTIVSRAVQLAGIDGGSIYEYDETREQFHLHATDKLPDELVEALSSAPIPKGEGALGRLAVTGEPVQIGDIVDERSYQSRVREILIRLGYRSLLAVPLLREEHLLGGLVVNRKNAGEFAPEIIELLKTFATQSALAIQNARLFREIEDKSRQLEIASQHKSEFLANMSHELRTPLNAIIGFSEVLYEKMFGEINDKQAEYLSDILESGRHLLSLINDILDLSKIEAGRMELEPSEFDLPAAIENTLILVRERAQRRGITLGHTVDARLGMIRADERKLKQVLLNLLSNALKFTPEGGRIDVVAAAHDCVTEISVTDTGVGIAPEDQEAVFEEFRQVGTAARKVEGTGLGLAISRKFIELHGGRIWVKSQVGMGSTFAFTVPLTIDQRHQTGS